MTPRAVHGHDPDGDLGIRLCRAPRLQRRLTLTALGLSALGLAAVSAPPNPEPAARPDVIIMETAPPPEVSALMPSAAPVPPHTSAAHQRQTRGQSPRTL